MFKKAKRKILSTINQWMNKKYDLGVYVNHSSGNSTLHTTEKWKITKYYLKKIFLALSLLFIFITSIKMFHSLFVKSSIPIKLNKEFSEKKIENLNNVINEYYKNTTIPEVKDHLIIVTGHGISKNLNEFPMDKDMWYLKPFQDQEKVNAFLTQILTGIFIASSNPNSVLIFSGGQTQIEAGPQSEAQSYWSIANSINWYNNNEIKNRATTEEFSKDSFENLLFSICRYHEFTGKYPKFISVISFPFKHYRFFNLHRNAIKYPSKHFQFVSVNADTLEKPNADLIFEHPSLEIPKDLPQFEVNHSIMGFINDPYGCQGKLLDKKIQRNPFKRYHPYSNSCPELQKIFNYCGKEVIPDELDWLNL